MKESQTDTREVRIDERAPWQAPQLRKLDAANAESNLGPGNDGPAGS